MHRLVTEADETLQIVVRPARVERMTLMAGIRSDRGIAGLQGTEHERGVHDRAYKAAATAHDELAVPGIRQQELEVRLGADHP